MSLLSWYVALALVWLAPPVYASEEPRARAAARLEASARFEAADCSFDGFEIPEGESIDCGFLIVPENRARSDSKAIRLAVAILRSVSPTPRADPVIFLSGGPGSASLTSVGFWASSSIRESRDLILVDQRGTGYSQPSLSCPEIAEAAPIDEPSARSQEEQIMHVVQAATTCRDRLLAEGVDLSAYNSASNAADMNDLRLALGLERWNLYGLSYGGRLALTLMRDHPEGIRSVILDSARIPQVNEFEQNAADKAQALNDLFEGCAADVACRSAFPDLESEFYELVDRLNADPIQVSTSDAASRELFVTGDDLVGGLFEALANSSLIPYLPLAGNQIYQGNRDVLEALINRPGGSRSDFSYGLHYSVLCYEEAPFNDPLKVQASWEAHPVLKGYLTSNSLPSICAVWGSGQASAIENEAVHSDIPTLVLAGQYDPIHPPSWSGLAAETLTSSFYFEVPGTGHGASFGPCQSAIRDRFLNEPAVEPDDSCLKAMEGPFFVTDPYLNPGVFKVATGLLQKPNPLQLAWIGSCLLLFLSGLLVWPSTYLISRRDGRAIPTTRLARAARWAAAANALLNLVFVAVLLLLIVRLNAVDRTILLFGLPSSASPLFSLPVITTILALLMVVFSWLAWQNRFWTVAGRLHYALMSLAALAFPWFLVRWSLLTF